jgi:hypothetical protein
MSGNCRVQIQNDETHGFFAASLRRKLDAIPRFIPAFENVFICAWFCA